MKVYFDNSATTPLHPKVFEKMKSFLTDDFGNASSIHSFGRKARVGIENAREIIAGFINANPGEIYFTSGGTEANNFIIRGIAKTEFLESGRNKIITSLAEHHSVIDTFKDLSQNGFQTELIKIRQDSSTDVHQIINATDDLTSLISLIHINNETGAINNIEDISPYLNNKKIYVHTDAVQSFGKIKIDVKKLSFDSMSASAHKINGPKGAGIAFVKSGTPLSPLIFGGSQERNRRGGTENVAAIAGLAEAVNIASSEMEFNFEHVSKLRNEFLNGLESISENKIRINGKGNFPYILSITLIPEYFNNDAEAMLIYLDINGIAASNGSACTSGTLKPSHVIINSGFSQQDASGTIRFSFGYKNTLEEVYYTLDVLKKMIKKFHK